LALGNGFYRMQLRGPHQLQADQHRAEGRGVDQEGSGCPDGADHEAGDGGPDDPGEVEHGTVERDRVRHPGPPDHLDGETLPGRIVHDGDQAERERQGVNLPDPHRTGDRQHAQDQGQAAHRRLGRDQDAALGIPVGDHPAIHAEEHREELQAGGNAERRAAVVSELQHKPVLRDALHPAAGVGDDLPGREQPVVTCTE
jgi:hypothetical protein